jgi:hypothetical protein
VRSAETTMRWVSEHLEYRRVVAEADRHWTERLEGHDPA